MEGFFLWRPSTFRQQKMQMELEEVERMMKSLHVVQESGGADVTEVNLLECVTAVMSDNLDLVLVGVRTIRKALAIETCPKIDFVVNLGVVPRLVELSKVMERPEIQYEALWSLTNIGSGTTEHVRILLNNGTLTCLLWLLQNPDVTEDVLDQTIWAVGNIAGDCVATRNAVIESGAHTVIVQRFVHNAIPPKVYSNAFWFLSNVVRNKPHPSLDDVRCIIPILERGLEILPEDSGALLDCIWAIQYIADFNDEAIRNISCVPRLVALSLHPDRRYADAAFRACGNIVSGDDVSTQIALNANLLQVLQVKLSNADFRGNGGSNNKRSNVRELMWCLSNVTAGSVEQVRAVIENGLIPLVVRCCAEATDSKIATEALWVLSNATSAKDPTIVSYLVHSGAMQAVMSMTRFNDDKIVSNWLEFFSNVLGVDPNYRALFEGLGGLKVCEQLQLHPHVEIYMKALELLGNHFVASEETAEVVS